ncbi:hypothetical protein PPERSA_12846 [Pseudocohnilembus persalinus]|uniref:SPRY domain-containing protein n=1 Tax=Pseudocohnilembus persalinus TaxID=266149 RepID=A0A0V0QVP3_PSEPJ|nr:hypothetical protein PPERSA_12846 [Pseudocohnilembus persalinus]|eukprot:KRX06157.1 hypothetical protein PPERSA_12846 [Pseudocohnilembus persalinus]
MDYSEKNELTQLISKLSEYKESFKFGSQNLQNNNYFAEQEQEILTLNSQSSSSTMSESGKNIPIYEENTNSYKLSQGLEKGLQKIYEQHKGDDVIQENIDEYDEILQESGKYPINQYYNKQDSVEPEKKSPQITYQKQQILHQFSNNNFTLHNNQKSDPELNNSQPVKSSSMISLNYPLEQNQEQEKKEDNFNQKFQIQNLEKKSVPDKLLNRSFEHHSEIQKENSESQQNNTKSQILKERRTLNENFNTSDSSPNKNSTLYNDLASNNQDLLKMYQRHKYETDDDEPQALVLDTIIKYKKFKKTNNILLKYPLKIKKAADIEKELQRDYHRHTELPHLKQEQKQKKLENLKNSQKSAQQKHPFKLEFHSPKSKPKISNNNFDLSEIKYEVSEIASSHSSNIRKVNTNSNSSSSSSSSNSYESDSSSSISIIPHEKIQNPIAQNFMGLSKKSKKNNNKNKNNKKKQNNYEFQNKFYKLKSNQDYCQNLESSFDATQNQKQINQTNSKQTYKNLLRRNTTNFDEPIISYHIPGQKPKATEIQKQTQKSTNVLPRAFSINSLEENAENKEEFKKKHKQVYLYEHEKRYLSKQSNIHNTNYIFGNYSIKDTKKLKMSRVYYFNTDFYLPFLISDDTFGDQNRVKVGELISFIQFIYLQDPNSDKSLMRYPKEPHFYSLYQGLEEEPGCPDMSLPQVNIESYIEVLDFGDYSFFSTELVHKDIKIYQNNSKLDTVQGTESSSNVRKYALIKPEINPFMEHEYIFHINSVDPNELLAIGICEQEIVKRQKFYFNDKSQGVYLMQSNGTVFSSHNQSLNKTKQEFSFGQGDILTIKVDLSSQTITFYNRMSKEQYTLKTQDITTCNACVVLTSNQDKVQFETEEECEAFQQPNLVLLENSEQLNEYFPQIKDNNLDSSNLSINSDLEKFMFYDEIEKTYKKKKSKQNIEDFNTILIKIAVLDKRQYSALIREEQNLVLENLYLKIQENSGNQNICQDNCYFSYQKDPQYAQNDVINDIQQIQDLDPEKILYCHFKDFYHGELDGAELQSEILQQPYSTSTSFQNSQISLINKTDQFLNNQNYIWQNPYLKIPKSSSYFNLTRKLMSITGIADPKKTLTQYPNQPIFNSDSEGSDSDELDNTPQRQFEQLLNEINFDVEKYEQEHVESYEEFPFSKIQYKKKQEKLQISRRVIGIDGEKIYNKLEKSDSIFSSFMKIFRPNLKTKNSVIQFEDIIDIKISKRDRRKIDLAFKQEQGRVKVWKLYADDQNDAKRFFIKVYLLKVLIEAEDFAISQYQ